VPERLIAVGLGRVFIRQIANASERRVLCHQFTDRPPRKSISSIYVHRQWHRVLPHQIVRAHAPATMLQPVTAAVA